jgi:hypothetical protein
MGASSKGTSPSSMFPIFTRLTSLFVIQIKGVKDSLFYKNSCGKIYGAVSGFLIHRN